MRHLALLLLLLSTGVALAAGPEPLPREQYLAARFEHERRIAGFDQPLTAAGTLLLTGSGDLIWRTETPFPTDLVVTPKSIAQFVGGQPTMRLPLSTAGPFGQLNTFLMRLIRGDWTDLGFEGEADGERWMATLKGAALPAFIAQQVSGIEARGQRFVEEVIVSRPGGETERFRFADQALHGEQLRSEDQALLDRATAE